MRARREHSCSSHGAQKSMKVKANPSQALKIRTMA